MGKWFEGQRRGGRREIKRGRRSTEGKSVQLEKRIKTLQDGGKKKTSRTKGVKKRGRASETGGERGREEQHEKTAVWRRL